MSMFPEWASSRTIWGIGVLVRAFLGSAISEHSDRLVSISYSSWTLRYDSQGSLFVKITADDGTVGYATGFGGPPACWLIEEHFKRFVVGQDPRNTNVMWEQVSVAD